MKRTSVYIGDSQDNDLRKLSNNTGLSVSEIVRRAVDVFLQQKPTTANVPKTHITLKQTNIYFSDMQTINMKDLSKKMTLSVSEIIRRAINFYLQQNKEN